MTSATKNTINARGIKLKVHSTFTKPIIDTTGNQTTCFCRKEDIPKLAEALGIRIKDFSE